VPKNKFCPTKRSSFPLFLKQKFPPVFPASNLYLSETMGQTVAVSIVNSFVRQALDKRTRKLGQEVAATSVGAHPSLDDAKE